MIVAKDNWINLAIESWPDDLDPLRILSLTSECVWGFHANARLKCTTNTGLTVNI